MSIKVVNGLDLASQKITSVLDPTSAQDAATKAYVDTGFSIQMFAGRRTSNYALPSGSGTLCPIPLDTEDVKTSGITHSTVTNSSRVTPTVAGYYACVGSLFWNSDTDTTQRKCILRKNGTTTVPGSQSLIAYPGGSQLIGQAAPLSIVQMNGSTDYIELCAAASVVRTLFGNSTDGPMLVLWRLSA